MTVPRSEYPRPSMVRKDWLCLNGKWGFEIDCGDSGLKRGLLDKELDAEIIVPFCPESELSGIGNTDFMNAVWYRREVEIPAEWKGKRVNLIFQAVDYDTTVWVNGRQLSRHRGGFTPITVELPENITGGDTATIVVRARDDHRTPRPMGKQSERYEKYGCRYTRTTGIWQSVWMEPVSPRAYFQRPRITPDLSNSRFKLVLPIRGDRPGLSIEAELCDEQGVIASKNIEVKDFQGSVDLELPADRLKLWDVGEGNLYDINLKLIDGEDVVDEISTYAGMRSVSIEGKAVRINGRTVFQRLVLDQGYYEDGIMTAPSDEALIRDIEISLAAGFNGARLHQKVFEERFVYYADRMGYLAWGEFGDWFGPQADIVKTLRPTWITQWLEVVERDYSHPSLVGWCPMNECPVNLEDKIDTLDDVELGMFLACKALDQTRPVIDVSGWGHRVPMADIWDCHDYEQDAEIMAEHYARLGEGEIFENGKTETSRWSVDGYNGQPFFNSEFGGTWWNPEAAEKGGESWGYGNRPKDIEEFYTRFDSLCKVLLDNPYMFGYCYTQLTDVFQEQNGVVFFDRSEKFDMARLAASQQRVAAIEKLNK